MLFLTDSSTFQSYGSCQTHCGEDFAFGILQNHDCWCSNVAPGKNVSMKHCNSHCPGYPADNCGGSNVYAYYSIGADPTSTAAGSVSCVSIGVLFVTNERLDLNLFVNPSYLETIILVFFLVLLLRHYHLLFLLHDFRYC